ncbi:hypothetical protein UCREL1_9417 [Eutypa lata UCREL1]|uniref:DUF4048 domain-containing protein n=1 Tax=Eutypa lata (strain UCR-EL1) TaxID=1287681 RepID=M7T1I9_EUTLA|nr:hypothetical protein UCREL1_9417 [Eutypa lata UCREL1]
MAVPPTPLETSTVTSPTDPNEFIVAIAAQERRVLELREELSVAEGELRRLKKQFTVAEGYKKRASQRTSDSLRAMAALTGQAEGSSNYEDNSPGATQRTSELERRKAILLAQSQGTPREYKRTVIRGGHARTLSLLSPTRPVAEFPALESLENHDVRRSIDSSSSRQDWKPRSAATINKRATWAPRQTQPPNGVKQIANDFKQGLWTFVEDLRQATVGDEAISGNSNRTSEMMAARLNRANGASDQDTIRASSGTPTSMTRGRIPFPTETSSETSTPIRSNFSSSSASFHDRFHQQERQKMASNATSKTGESITPTAAATKARKHFSWTPLTFDQFDDDDWSNWDTPTVKQSRWSGSTVNGDIMPAPVSDKSDENEGTLRRKRSLTSLRSASQSPTRNADGTMNVTKLEELPQVILNRLSPGNIKRTAADFMREWEKSLSPPPETASNTFFGEDDVEALARAAAHAQ